MKPTIAVRRLLVALADASPAFATPAKTAEGSFLRRLLIAMSDSAPPFQRQAYILATKAQPAPEAPPKAPPTPAAAPETVPPYPPRESGSPSRADRATTARPVKTPAAARSARPAIDILDANDREYERVIDSDERLKRHVALHEDRRKTERQHVRMYIVRLAAGVIALVVCVIVFLVALVVLHDVLPNLSLWLAARIVGLAFLAAGGGVAIGTAGRVLATRFRDRGRGSNADFRAGTSAPGSGELESEVAAVPPGDGGVAGECGVAQDG